MTTVAVASPSSNQKRRSHEQAFGDVHCNEASKKTCTSPLPHDPLDVVPTYEKPPDHCAITSVSFDVFSLFGSYMGAAELGALACTGSPFIVSALAQLEDVRWSMEAHANEDHSHRGMSLIFGKHALTGTTPNPLHQKLRHLLVSQLNRSTACRRCMGRPCVITTLLPLSACFANLKSLIIDDRPIISRALLAVYAGKATIADLFPVLESLVIRAHPMDKFCMAVTTSPVPSGWQIIFSVLGVPPTLREFEVQPLSAPNGSSLTPFKFNWPFQPGSPLGPKLFLSNLPPTLEILRLPCVSFTLSHLNNLPYNLRTLSARYLHSDLDRDKLALIRFPASLEELSLSEGAPAWLKPVLHEKLRTQCPLMPRSSIDALFGPMPSQ